MDLITEWRHMEPIGAEVTLMEVDMSDLEANAPVTIVEGATMSFDFYVKPMFRGLAVVARLLRVLYSPFDLSGTYI